MAFASLRRIGLVLCVLFLTPELVLAQLGPNVALNQPATQSSQLGGFAASLAVDGDLNNFTHTAASADLPGASWWEVDLGADSDIIHLRIGNRLGCCGSRLRDIVVQVFNSGGTVVYGPDLDLTLEADLALVDPGDILNAENALGGGALNVGPASIEIDVQAQNGGSPIVGQRVRISRIPDPDNSGVGGAGNPDESTVLSLGEVQVFTPITDPPSFTAQPLGGEVPPGCPFQLSATVSGAESFQWLLNGAEIPGATGASYAIAAMSSSDAGDYQLRASNSLGDTLSDVAAVTVRPGPVNWAPFGTATSSTEGFGGVASRAIDCNTNGVYPQGSVTHTNTGDADPWWEVDLGQLRAIGSVILWNRTDCCGDRLNNVRVQILDEARNAIHAEDITTAPSPSVELVAPGRTFGRYVRVQYIDPAAVDPGQRFISLAEVEVLGSGEAVKVPAASSFTLALLAVAGLLMGAFVLRRRLEAPAAA